MRNTYLSITFYILTIIFYFVLNSPITIPFFLCALIGIFFAHMSNRKKESKQGGTILMLVGFLIFLFPFYITPLIMMIDSIFIQQ
jgi:4-amino-4-deoxy-L-arabinose transferase-like glycosyltransferase